MGGGQSGTTRRWRVIAAAVSLVTALAVVATGQRGRADAAPTITNTHFRPAGIDVSIAVSAQGISTDGRYVGFYANGATGRYDRQAGTPKAGPYMTGLSGNGRYTMVGTVRWDLDTGATYDPGVPEAPCCNSFGLPRFSADGSVYTINYQNGTSVVGAVVDVTAASLTTVPGIPGVVSGDGRFLTYVKPLGGTEMVDRTTGQTTTLPDGAWFLSAGGRYQAGFVVGTTDLQWRDGATNTVVALRGRFPTMAPCYQVRGFSDDGRRLLYVGFDQKGYLVDLVGNEVLPLTGAVDIAGVYLSGDGHHVTYTDGSDLDLHVLTIGDSTPADPPPPPPPTTTTPPATTPPTTTLAVVEPAAPSFGGMIPDRVLDTRNGETDTVPNVAPGSVVAVQVAGRPDVPANAAAVALNVTATNAGGPGFVTVWPCDATRPTASNLNFTLGQTVANGVVSAVSADGRVCLYTHAAADLVIDVTGWFPPAAALQPLVPRRLADTRNGETDTAPNQAAGAVLAIDARAAGIPVLAGGVVINVTVSNPTAPGFVTVWPCGVDRPDASNLNFDTGQTVANSVMSSLGTDGTVCVYTHTAADIIVDVNGWLRSAGGFGALVPTRLTDTRAGDTDNVPNLAAGATVRVDLAGRVAVPSSAAGVVLNVTATNPSSPGFVTVWACDTQRPIASNLNVAAGQTAANAVLVAPAADGSVCVYTQAAADLIVDIAGWFA